MSLGFVGNAPINVALNNNNFEVSLNETAIGQNSQFNTSSVALFDGNINSLTLDKYGRITNISTGYTLPTPNQINYLKIAGDSGSNINAQITDLSNSDTLTFTGKTGHISTELVNKSIVTELLPTGISNSDEYTYEITNVDAGTNGLLIRKLGSNTNVTNLTLSKGKVYIFRQYDNTSTNTNSSLSTHGAGLSTSINGGNIYTEGIEYFIKNSQGVLLGPLSHTDYYNNFIVRGSNREPYFTLKLPNNAPNTLYLYSMSTPTLVNNITLNISNNIEYITYDNVNSLVVDSYGRLHSVKQTPNLDTLMTQFNIRGDDTNQIVVKHNNILDIYGQEGHIKSYVQNNNLYSRLAETKIISTDTDNVSVVIESTVDVINSAVKWYNPSTPNTTFTSLNLLKGRSYKFYQINPLNQTHGMGISTSQISVIEYTTGVEYHVVIGSVDTVVQPNDYNNYFTNPALNGSSAYILFNVPYDAPSKLYMYSRLSSIVAELELNAIGDFRKIDNVLSITVDRFGRIQDAISGVDNNRVEFIIELDGYNTLSFGLIQRSVYIQTLIAYFTVIEYSDVSLNVVDVNNKARITTSINEISTIKSQSIIANINNLQNIANTATNFKNSLVNNGLNLLTGFTIIQAGTNISLPNNSNFSSFNVNVNSNNINISNLSTLQLLNTPPIVLTENVNNKSINFSLETLSGSSTNYTGGITELNVDTFGRVTNVVTGNSNLPLSGVTAGTYNPSISEIVVNQYGIITSITASNLPNDINNEVTRATNAENTLTTNLTNEINRATSAESTLTINLNNEITRATNAENTNSTSITNETNRAISIEGILTNLNTSNKTNLVESINSEVSRALNIENTLTTNLTNEINRATAAETTLTNNLSNEITRATGVETTINNKLNIIGPLTDYSSSNTLLSKLGNLNNIIGSKTSLLDYINSIGNIDVYNATSTLSTALGDLSNIPSGSSISEFITKYGEANLLTLAAGRKTLLEIIGNNLVNNKYSYGPSSLSYGSAFDRDGYYPLFTTTNNLNTWKNTNIVAILDDALTRVTNPSADYTNIQNFKNAFVYDVAIGHNQTINHEWNVKLSFEPSTTTQIYYTITHPSSSTNPSISFTNTSSVAETITIPLNNIGTYSNSIIGDIATLEGQVSILNTKVGVNTGGSGAGADILGKLSALGDTPNFKNTMNSRTLVSVIGELSTGVAATWNNNTILQTIGEPTKLPGSTDITTELQRLGSLNNYSSNTLISKIGNISSITTTLKDIIDALGNITATYNSGSTLLNDLYTKSQVDTKIADLINSAPGALNTLNELAAALGNDANFSTTITTQLTNINNSISNVENTALSTWVGSTNITTLGTISTGVWQGTNLDINRINWTNKANLTALQTDLPAASNNSLIARVVGEGLYFSDGTNYKRVSNYDDVTTLLSGKQNAITAGPLSNSLTGPDFATNRVVISGGAGKLDVSAISTTQLGYLSDVTGNIGSALSGKQNTLSTGTLPLETISGLTITLSQLNTLTDVVPGNGNIQAQLNAKQPKVTNVSDTEIGYLDGVTSAIQTQLDAKQPKVTNVSDTEIGYLDGVTSAIQTQLDAKQPKVTNVSDTEIGYLDGVTSSIQTQLSNKQNTISTGDLSLTAINGITMSLTELNYITGVTSAIQTQLNAKQPKVTNVSDTEIGYLDGVTSAIQTQLDAKQAKVTNVSDTEIGYLDGVTSAIQTQLDAKQAKVTNVSDTEIGYLDGVTSSIQTQINNVGSNATPYKIDNLLFIDSSNIATTYQTGMSDNLYPKVCDQKINLYNDGKAWGVYTAKSGLNMSQAWRIIFKQQMTYYNGSANDPLTIGFEHGTNNNQWAPTVGGQFNTNAIHLRHNVATTVNTFSVNDTSSVPVAYFNTTNPTYTVITRLNGGETNIELYDHNHTLLWDTQITTILNYTENMIFTVYYNKIRAVVDGIFVEQGNAITTQNLEKMLSMNNYVQMQIKNNVFSNYKAYYGQFLDYYVSLNTDGTFNISGMQCARNPLIIKFGIHAAGAANGTGRTLYNDIASAPSSNTFLKDEDGVTWFKPPYATNPVNNVDRPTLLLTNLDTYNYDDFGFTIIFYLKNFSYRNVTSSNYQITNVMSLFSDDTSNNEIIKSRYLFFDGQYEYKIFSNKHSNVESAATPSAPRYQWHDTADFKHADKESTSTSTGVMIEHPTDVWFVAHTYKSGVLLGNTFGENTPSDKKQSQLFYKRSSFDKFNCGKVWEPTWAAGPDATWITEGLSKHFKRNSWLMFGVTKQSADSSYPSGGLTTSNWESFNIDTDATDMYADVDISEIMIFNKALSHEELSRLSKLSPSEAKSLLS